MGIAQREEGIPSEPGKCYKKVIISDLYSYETKRYPVYTGTDASVKTKKKFIVTNPHSKRWVKKPHQNCDSTDPNDCLVWCLNDIPEKSVTLLIVKDTSQTSDFVWKEVMVRYLEDTGGHTEWREVLCEENHSQTLWIEILERLKYLGYTLPDDGNEASQALQCIMNFQLEFGLPVGSFDIESLAALGIIYDGSDFSLEEDQLKVTEKYLNNFRKFKRLTLDSQKKETSFEKLARITKGDQKGMSFLMPSSLSKIKEGSIYDMVEIPSRYAKAVERIPVYNGSGLKENNITKYKVLVDRTAKQWKYKKVDPCPYKFEKDCIEWVLEDEDKVFKELVAVIDTSLTEFIEWEFVDLYKQISEPTFQRRSIIPIENIDSQYIAAIQEVLAREAYLLKFDSGFIEESTVHALRRYQMNNELCLGKLTEETVGKILGKKYALEESKISEYDDGCFANCEASVFYKNDIVWLPVYNEESGKDSTNTKHVLLEVRDCKKPKEKYEKVLVGQDIFGKDKYEWVVADPILEVKRVRIVTNTKLNTEFKWKKFRHIKRIIGGTGLVEREVLCGYETDKKRISELQNALQSQGFYKGDIDGVFNDKTQLAMRKFQMKKELPLGHLDLDTAYELNIWR